MNEKKLEKINEKLEELDWNDDIIPEIMEGFFNNPIDILSLDRCSENHLKSLWDILDCENEVD